MSTFVLCVLQVFLVLFLFLSFSWIILITLSRLLFTIHLLFAAVLQDSVQGPLHIIIYSAFGVGRVSVSQMHSCSALHLLLQQFCFLLYGLPIPLWTCQTTALIFRVPSSDALEVWSYVDSKMRKALLTCDTNIMEFLPPGGPSVPPNPIVVFCQWMETSVSSGVPSLALFPVLLFNCCF